MSPPSDRWMLRAFVRTLVLAAAVAAAIAIILSQRTQLKHLLEAPFLKFFAIRSAALLLYLAAVVAALAFVITSRIPALVKRISLLLAAVVISPALLEAVLMFTPRSHSNGASFANVVWYRYYWGTQNSLGYRDGEIDPAADAGLRKVLVVGDSFTAGAGISHRRDRFSDRLQTALGAGTRVYNAGVAGSDTTDEYHRLVAFPVQPQVVVLQYFGNDIEVRAPLFDAKQPLDDWPAIERTLTPAAKSEPGAAARVANNALSGLAGSRLITSCVDALFACNYISYVAPQPVATSYLEQLLRFYASPAVWTAHEADLKQFIDYARTRNIRLVVLIFPFMQQPEISRYYTNKVGTVFRRQGIPVVDLTEDAAKLSPSERVANSNDSHASPLVHQIAAERLLPYVQAAAR